MKLFSNNIFINTNSIVVPASVQRFRYGMDYAISSNSDNWAGNAEKVEFLSWKYGIRSTSYEAMSNSPVIRDQYTQNIFECSIYWLANKYSDPTDRATPDYIDSDYSASGEAVFNVTNGESKLQRYPNNGTQLYHITNGRLGVKLNRTLNSWDRGEEGVTSSDSFDPTNITDNALFIESYGTEGDGFKNTFEANKNTSPQRHKCFSYSLGQEGTWQQKAQYFISGRNSKSGGNATGEYFDEWDITDRYQVSQPSSVRVADSVSMVGDIATKMQWINDKITNQTIPNKGWFSNFNHWWSTDMVLQEALYSELQQIADGTSCWFAGMSEASEYRWFLNMITSVSASFNGSYCLVSVSIDNIYNLPISHIITPVSVEIDLSGTSLSGKNITSNKGGILSLGADKYIVEVNATDLFVLVSEGVEDYYDDINPSVLSSVLNGSDLTITTDQNTVVTLFSDELGTVVDRTYDKQKIHVINNVAPNTYYVGAMNNMNRTIIETITV